jgi:DNA invertase Pin-like site-specific DNA recombinase
MNAYGYGRASTNGQSLTIAAQKSKVEAYCAQHDAKLTWIEDPATSSRKRLDQREGGNLLCRAVEEGKVQAIVLPKLDRAFRNTVECLTKVQEWNEKGVSVHILDLGVDTNTHMGQFFLTILAAFGELERSLIAERTSNSMLHAQSQGKLVSKIPPYGYEVDPDSPLNDNGQHTRIRPCKKEQAIIQECGELRARGYGMTMIADELNRRGRRQRNGKPWRRQSVGRALKRL